MGLVPFVTASFKPLKTEGEETLTVMVEGTQLLCFSHFPSMLSPSTDRGHGTVNCGQGGDRWSSCPKSLKRLRSLPLPVWMSQLIFQWAAQVSTGLYMVQRGRWHKMIKFPYPTSTTAKPCIVCLLYSRRISLFEENCFWLWAVLVLWRLLGQGCISFENRWYRPNGGDWGQNSWRNYLNEKVLD